jgi:hypothetical protein
MACGGGRRIHIIWGNMTLETTVYLKYMHNFTLCSKFKKWFSIIDYIANNNCPRLLKSCNPLGILFIVSGVASPTIQSRYANIAMFINYQHNQFLKKWIMTSLFIVMYCLKFRVMFMHGLKIVVNMSVCGSLIEIKYNTKNRYAKRTCICAKCWQLSSWLLYFCCSMAGFWGEVWGGGHLPRDFFAPPLKFLCTSPETSCSVKW